MSPAREARRDARDASRPYAGKSLDPRRAEQRERVLLAARDVVGARGYAGAGIDEIVARARVSRTTFYAFYENEECLLALFTFGVERFAGPVLEAVAASVDLSPAERIRAEVRAVAQALAGDPAMARIVLIEIVGATPAAEKLRIEVRNKAARIIELQLETYDTWSGRTATARHVASLAAMAAIGEPLSELVATGRAADWQQVVDPISDFVARRVDGRRRVTSLYLVAAIGSQAGTASSERHRNRQASVRCGRHGSAIRSSSSGPGSSSSP